MIKAGQQVVILGAGITGRSVARYARQCGGHPVILDTRAAGDVDESLDIRWQVAEWPDMDVDWAVISPGLNMNHCLVRSAQAAGVTLWSDIDLFFAVVDQPVLGITGTNGKSTVTTLAGFLLRGLGLLPGVGGNLGEAAMDIVAPEHNCYVLELSSFQLERSQLHPYFRSVILNISEDHLDQHGDLDSYLRAKQMIYQQAAGCVINRAQPLNPEGTAPASLVSYGLDSPPGDKDWGVCGHAGEDWLSRGALPICPVRSVALTGRHNTENVLAACALIYDLASAHLDEADVVQKLAELLPAFRGLAHRFEQVADHQGVRFINDSKATNLGATQAALHGMDKANQVVLIAGGDAKGVDLRPLTAEFAGRVKHLVVLGAAAGQLSAIGEAAKIPVDVVADMPEAVALATRAAGPGDVVLLSPACSSLDMFTSFADRGEQFAQAARAQIDAQVGHGPENQDRGLR